MSGDNFGQEDGFFTTSYGDGQQQSQPGFYDPNSGQQAPQFGQDPQFGQFDYGQPQTSYVTETYYTSPSQGYAGSIMTPDPTATYASAGGGAENFDDEPPLLEELGINFDHIIQKTLAVLNPMKEAEPIMMQDTDLAGPLVFCLAFGGFLMLSGKLHFGYIYGIGMVGCLAMYCLLNLMSLTAVSAGCIISVLGYCLLPMVILSFSSIVMSLQGAFGIVLTSVTVLWCSLSASKLFVSALAMDHQQPLVAYPCTLVYGVFALLTVF